MKLIDITQCSNNWDFKPLKPWGAALPPISWKGQLITGFESKSDKALEVDEPIENIISDCYENLSIPELARFYLKSRNDLNDIWPKILKKYKCGPVDDCRILFQKISLTPIEFQNWISQKQLSYGELSILNLVKDDQIQSQLTDKLFKLSFLNPSKSEGNQILELTIELILMERKIDEIYISVENSKILLKLLTNLRFPNTLNKDQIRINKITNLPWPAHVRAQWIRSGDQAQLELSLKAKSARDLHNQLSGLSTLQKHIESEVWTAN